MGDAPDFANTPFAALAQKCRADKEKGRGAQGNSTPPPKKSSSLPKETRALPVDADAEDEETLFLEAMRTTVAVGQRKNTPPEAFRMEKHHAFQRAREVLAEARSPVPSKAPQPDTPSMTGKGEGTPTAAFPLDSAFARAMQDVKPLAGKGRAVKPALASPPSPLPAETSMQDVLDGKVEFALSLTGEYLEGYVVGLDERTMNKLRAGQYSPEAHLDLHGLNAMQAFQALLGFFRSAWYKGLRTVLVVPGRGRNSPDGVGILREKLQSWLTQEPFKRLVLAFCTARPSDGGAGSVYVLLRKMRKKGKIYWEKVPADPDLF